MKFELLKFNFLSCQYIQNFRISLASSVKQGPKIINEGDWDFLQEPPNLPTLCGGYPVLNKTLHKENINTLKTTFSTLL